MIDVENREITDLGIDTSNAYDINAWGQVVGAYFNSDWVQHVLYWDPTNAAWDLHPLVTLGGTSSRAAAINNSGQIAGWATDEDRQWQGFACVLYTGDVKHIGGVTDSLATAVNNQGLAVGRYRATPSTLSYRALAWDFATDTIVDLNELTGTTTGHSSSAGASTMPVRSPASELTASKTSTTSGVTC